MSRVRGRVGVLVHKMISLCADEVDRFNDELESSELFFIGSALSIYFSQQAALIEDDLEVEDEEGDEEFEDGKLEKAFKDARKKKGPKKEPID